MVGGYGGACPEGWCLSTDGLGAPAQEDLSGSKVIVVGQSFEYCSIEVSLLLKYVGKKYLLYLPC